MPAGEWTVTALACKHHGAKVEFLRLKNFERFQHYKDRRPPWVKLYVDLPRDKELAARPDARHLYVMLLCVAGLEQNHFPAGPAWISSEVSMPLGPTMKGLLGLLETGHVLPADPVAAVRAQLLADVSANGVAPRVRPRARGEAEAEAESYLRPVSEGEKQ